MRMATTEVVLIATVEYDDGVEAPNEYRVGACLDEASHGIMVGDPRYRVTSVVFDPGAAYHAS
jgi:hypothetical protein